MIGHVRVHAWDPFFADGQVRGKAVLSLGGDQKNNSDPASGQAATRAAV